MKKIIAILFLSSFFISQAGYQFIFMLQQYHLKEVAEKKVLAGLPDSSLEIIEQDKSIHWTEKEKEFYRHGEMYDVVKVKKLKGKILLYFLNDKKEKKILKDFANAAKSRNSNNGKTGKQTIKFQVKVYSNQTIQLLILADHFAHQNPFGLEPKIISSYQEINVPPPRA